MSCSWFCAPVDTGASLAVGAAGTVGVITSRIKNIVGGVVRKGTAAAWATRAIADFSPASISAGINTTPDSVVTCASVENVVAGVDYQ